ncbi:MAG: nitroreductase [Hyphomicrobiaceae bacterium]|nr:nitroreductase [Hyphomicrobiaceae bacterium]
MHQATLDLLARRRSVKADTLVEPGPDASQLERILTIAARVPDHKKLVPWRFVVFAGDARAAFGEKIAAACQAEEKEPPSQFRLDTERKRFSRAPLVVAVISRIVAKPGAPEWEQILSAGAACFNLCVAANASGFGTTWLTEWIAYSPAIRTALGLADTERVAGFVYIGTRSATPEDRERPHLADIVTHWPSA